jgi:P-type Mg2+ transporter
MTNDKKDDVDFKSMYGEATILKTADIINEKKINLEKGLSTKQVKEKIEKNGYNIISKSKEKRWYNYFFESLFSKFNLILLGIVVVLFYTDVILAEKPSYANIIVIIILVLTSTFLEFFEEFKSNKAAAKLKEMVATKSTVIRNGKKVKILNKDIVIGDIVVLSAGDMIPADLRVLEAKDLYIGQSSLTGESDSVRKLAESELKSIDDIEFITDIDTICFMGTNVISGSAKAVVIKTADDTYFGKVSHTLTTGKPKTAFEKGIENISKLLMKFMLIMVPITFLLNVWKHNTLTAFTFSVSVAITITPLLLPVILSSSLAKGAVNMSKKKTIVKRLESIQGFGGMNILCTDKTGTLTEDRIVLEKYLNVNGEEDYGVLKQAYLNAYFQTGLKGSIDEAIIKRANENGLAKEIDGEFKIIDEIPFDFTRRRLSVIVTNGTKKELITKGAVEEILSISSFVEYKGQVSGINNEIKTNIRKIAKEMNKQGLRVVAVCKKYDIENIKNFKVSDENKMILTGFIGFLDPPKESAKEAIEKLNKASIRVIVLTGDNSDVTKCVCDKVNISTSQILVGNQIDKMSDMALKRVIKRVNVFAKLSPIQKARIIRILKEAGNTVGYMGDGINDSPSLINSDIGISVDTAVDIAKETADIILLEKDLNVLLDGVKEGRKTYANLIKYIKLATSFNFGEVISVIIASVILPFLPETPIQLLVEGLIYDLGQLTLPFDNVDEEHLDKPKNWNTNSLKRFMLVMGPLSTLFDMIVFAAMWFEFNMRGNSIALFQTIWFTYSIISNLVGMHIIRTNKKPIIQSHASKAVYASSISISIFAILIPYTILGKAIGLVPIGFKYILVFMLAIPALYCIVAQFVKKRYIKKYGEWL